MARINLEGLFETMVWYPASTSALTGRLGTKPMNDELIWMMGTLWMSCLEGFMQEMPKALTEADADNSTKKTTNFARWIEWRDDGWTMGAIFQQKMVLLDIVLSLWAVSLDSWPTTTLPHQPIIENIATVIYAAVSKGFICKIVLRANCNQIGKFEKNHGDGSAVLLTLVKSTNLEYNFMQIRIIVQEGTVP